MPGLPDRAKTRNGGEQTDASTSGFGSLRERVRQAAMQIESKIIMEALEQHRWNRRRTAEALRISYRSLMYKMKSCKLRDDSAADRLPRTE